MEWNINWREIFGNRNGECRVRVRFISSSSTSLNWQQNIGSLRATFSILAVYALNLILPHQQQTQPILIWIRHKQMARQ